jgi:predicted  nucleic acid-binding Zn-ribbon protein
MAKRRRIGDLIKQEIDKNDQSPEQMPETTQPDSASNDQIKELEAELAAKDKTIAKLEKDLAATKQLKTELENAKKDALNLAKENTHLKNRIDENRHAHSSGGALIPHEVVVQAPEPTGDFALNTWLL